MGNSTAPGVLLKDRYRLDRLLGRGGMAAVWLGNDEVLERPVAIKVLSDTIASDPEFLARFRREAMVAAALSHPNLVDVYDFGEGGERPYLVMEFVPGDDLGSQLSRGARIDCERLAEELLGAVAHIHAVGILHRDIKPQNIVIALDGSAKLIDFGIALPRDATSLTQTGLVLGTERYAAPEVMEGKPATDRSDLYSCGVVLRSSLATGSPALRALVSRLTNPDPRERPATAEQALAELASRARAGQPTEAFSPTPARPLLSPRRSSRWATVAAIVAVLAAVAVAVLMAGGGGDGRGGGGKGPEAANGAVASGLPGSAGAGSAEVAAEPDASPSPPVPAGEDPALASSLNQEGFELIQAGSYEEAVPLLEESIRAFPPGTEDIDYAYALFNLGSALRLSGRAEEAIPVLERRLEIPDQTEVVRHELDAARQEAG